MGLKPCSSAGVAGRTRNTTVSNQLADAPCRPDGEPFTAPYLLKRRGSFKTTAASAGRALWRVRRRLVGRVPGRPLLQRGGTFCPCIPATGCASAGVRSTGLGQTEDPGRPRHRTCSKARPVLLPGISVLYRPQIQILYKYIYIFTYFVYFN